MEGVKRKSSLFLRKSTIATPLPRARPPTLTETLWRSVVNKKTTLMPIRSERKRRGKKGGGGWVSLYRGPSRGCAVNGPV